MALPTRSQLLLVLLLATAIGLFSRFPSFSPDFRSINQHSFGEYPGHGFWDLEVGEQYRSTNKVTNASALDPSTWSNHTLVAILSNIRSQGPTAACYVDTALPHGPPDRRKKYLFAFNLVNSDGLMAQLITQLVLTLLLFDRDHVYVSIYESGSYDCTRDWLHLLDKLLTSMSIRHTFVLDGQARREGEERIVFLSRMRNLAMQPLYRSDFDADHVVFINDVAFCSQDVIRLLQHDADFKCGVDMWNWNGVPKSCGEDLAAVEKMIPEIMPPTPHELGQYLNLKWQHVPPVSPQDNVFPNSVRPLQFYDNWVAHDLDGQRFRVEYPYANLAPHRNRSMAGLPFPVQCCWNGMAAFSAEPLKRGLRFRSNTQGECYSSECSLLCDDFWRLGYTRFLVDPSVRVTYSAEMYRFLHHVKNRPSSTWRQVMDAPTVDWSTVTAPQVIDCCEGGKWEFCQHDFKWLEKNYTDVAIQTGFAPSTICYKHQRHKCRPPR